MEKIKLYIRILKELGLYDIYKKSRMSSRPTCPIFEESIANRSCEFSDFIDSSFTWVRTDFEKIWVTLNGLSTGWDDDDFMLSLKEKISSKEFLDLKSKVIGIIQ